jgi:hypothetical protein
MTDSFGGQRVMTKLVLDEEDTLRHLRVYEETWSETNEEWNRCLEDLDHSDDDQA